MTIKQVEGAIHYMNAVNEEMAKLHGR